MLNKLDYVYQQASWFVKDFFGIPEKGALRCSKYFFDHSKSASLQIQNSPFRLKH